MRLHRVILERSGGRDEFLEDVNSALQEGWSFAPSESDPRENEDVVFVHLVMEAVSDEEV